jgi:hypothetical protein
VLEKRVLRTIFYLAIIRQHNRESYMMKSFPKGWLSLTVRSSSHGKTMAGN